MFPLIVDRVIYNVWLKQHYPVTEFLNINNSSGLAEYCIKSYHIKQDITKLSLYTIEFDLMFERLACKPLEISTCIFDDKGRKLPETCQKLVSNEYLG